MPLYLTGSHSSRVRKSCFKPPSLRRSISSPFSNLPKRKPGQRAMSVDRQNRLSPNLADEKLDDSGTVISLATMSSVDGVLDAIRQSEQSMFGDMPGRAGMTSTRIAKVLNFRKSLPPIVSLAHVHGLITVSTRTEREIAGLMASGQIRKVTVAGRGNDISGLAEFLVLTQQLEARIRGSSLEPLLADAFIRLLRQQPRATNLAADHFLPDEIAALRNSGFLLSSGIARQSSMPAAARSRLTPATISQQPSGSVAAAGGDAAFDRLGGIGIARAHQTRSDTTRPAIEFTLSLPNIGAYLRLLSDAREHLLELLGRSKYREAPLYLLRERWDGGIDSDAGVSKSKRMRGEFAGILPGRTKKWKLLYGLNFDWILAECLGAGLVELFETNSVGHGVRIV